MNYKYLIIGIVLMPVGIYFIYDVFKNPVPIKRDLNVLNFKGIVWGIMTIIFGIVLIIHAFK